MKRLFKVRATYFLAVPRRADPGLESLNRASSAASLDVAPTEETLP